MTTPRLKTAFWVASALRTGDLTGQPGMVLRKGDVDSGDVLVVLRGSTGLVALARAHDGEGETGWMRATGPEPLPQSELDAWLDFEHGVGQPVPQDPSLQLQRPQIVRWQPAELRRFHEGAVCRQPFPPRRPVFRSQRLQQNQSPPQIGADQLGDLGRCRRIGGDAVRHRAAA